MSSICEQTGKKSWKYIIKSSGILLTEKQKRGVWNLYENSQSSLSHIIAHTYLFKLFRLLYKITIGSADFTAKSAIFKLDQ